MHGSERASKPTITRRKKGKKVGKDVFLWLPFMKDKDDLALDAVFVCTTELAA